MANTIDWNHVPEALKNYFQNHTKVALAFSGGVDSAYLLYAAKACGADVAAYFVKGQFQPEFERQDAQNLAADLDVRLTVLTGDILANPTVVANPPDRCYHCKRTVFGLITAAAKADGYPVLMDGANASDDAGDRPGMRATHELGVHSPLRDCGLDKATIRALSKAAGLFTHDKPSYACLATRIPTGRPYTAGLLQRVEAAEGQLFDMGYSDFRVRVVGEAAKLQMNAAFIARAFAERERIADRLAPYFTDVLLDLKAR